MKRSTFLKLTLAGSAAVYFPLFSCSNKKSDEDWIKPALLSTLCDDNLLKTIGADYYKQQNSKMDADQLRNELLTHGRQKIKPTANNHPELISFIDQKVTEDFNKDRTIILKGWVLSQTEAQQCALFYLL